MLYILSQVLCELYIGCDLPKDQEFVITLLHKDHCTSCDDIMPILEEIDSRLERNNKKVTIRYKNCSVCDCKEIKDEELPTVRINQNEVELSKINDLSGFRSITDKIIEITGYDKNIFTRRIKTNPGHVVKLNERDFYSGFDGPWIILFYNKTSDAKRELIYRLAPQYKSKIHVGEINGNNSEVLLNRFAISYLPTMIALYDGLIVGYNGKDNMDELRDFADELVKPSFTNLTLEEFKNLKRITPHSDPIFIVFYNEVGLANETFKNIAHDYKFRANIYKSNDPELMKLANVTVLENHLELCVYKNMIFHFASQNIMRSEKLYEWIWHAHYPSVAQLSNDNFYAIMHGLKPSIILLSKNEELVPEFQLASEFIHRGEPFADQIFASINVETYSLFIPKLLPKISIPSLVILNPAEQKFYTKKVKLTKDNMKDTVEKMIELNNMGQLESYPFKTSYYRYIFLLIGVMGLVYILNSKIKQKKYKIIENIGQN